jgi:pyrroline-5-carboxylate reductase
MKIGILGTGTITSAVVEGIAADGHHITVSERSRARSADLAARFGNVTAADNQTVVDISEVVFLGLMAEQAAEILSALVFRPEQQVITLMAGATLEEVSGMVAPARAAAIMMPFPGIARGGSPVMAQGDTALIEEIFGNRNSVFAVSNAAEMEAYLCAQAALSPAVKLVSDAAEWLGKRVSDPQQGEAFLRMLTGSSLLAAPCSDMLEALNTPGGYNQRLRLHMEAAGMGRDLARGLDDLAQAGG